MTYNFSEEIIRAIAEDASSENVVRLINTILASNQVIDFKFVWLNEQRNESLWFERDYSFSFGSKKLFFKYHEIEFLLLYYHSPKELDDKNLVAIIHYYYFRYRKEQNNLSKNYIYQDLNLAAKMQQFLVPKNLYCNSSFCASGLYIPNYQVGGDFYDVIPINDYKIGFCIGDISGKGVNAAIMMSYFIGFIRSTLLTHSKLEDTIETINQKIYELTEGEKFITLFLGIYNIQDKRLVYINSGHVPIPLYNSNELEWLESGTTILGAFKKLPFIELGKRKIESTSTLFLYTDGLLNINIDHEPFLSKNELSYLLQNECKGLKPNEISDYFEIKSKTITVEDDVKDDISLLAISLT